MRALRLLVLLALLTAASAYTFHMPVVIQSSTSPVVLMPGDTAVVTIELENGAAQYGAGEESRGATLSTPVNRTVLLGNDEIEVLSGDYDDIGLIGPNDEVPIYYKIKAREGIPDGTYFLDFVVIAGYDMDKISRKIPVKVDSAAVSLSRADDSAKSSISLNVANPRANTLNAVTILPISKGIRFSPEEYYVGTMDPDEVFTISFTVDSGKPGAVVKGPVDLSFSSRFKNGETWHRSALYNTSYMPLPESQGKSNLVPAGALVLLPLAAGGYLYRRKRHAEREPADKEGSGKNL